MQDLYLAKRQRDAAAAVPLEFIDRTSLLGPKERIAERMREYAAAGRDHPVGEPRSSPTSTAACGPCGPVAEALDLSASERARRGVSRK